jgi:hypothetical protein
MRTRTRGRYAGMSDDENAEWRFIAASTEHPREAWADFKDELALRRREKPPTKERDDGPRDDLCAQ